MTYIFIKKQTFSEQTYTGLCYLKQILLKIKNVFHIKIYAIVNIGQILSKGVVTRMISPRGKFHPCLLTKHCKWLHVLVGVKFHPGAISPLS